MLILGNTESSVASLPLRKLTTIRGKETYGKGKYGLYIDVTGFDNFGILGLKGNYF